MFVLHAKKLRWLFWLRLVISVRSLTRRKGYVIGTVILLLLVVLLAGGAAVGTFFAYRTLPALASAEVLFLVLTGVYLAWMVLPLFEFSLNEGLDLSKLQIFPLTRAEWLSSLLLSTLLDVPMIALVFIFAAVLAGWATSLLVGAFILLTLLLFTVLVVATSQFVLALFMRTLQSRRFRDLSLILLVMAGSLCSLLFIFSNEFLDVAKLESGQFSAYLQWFPPGMVTRSILLAAHGDWLMAWFWFAAVLVICVIVLALWLFLLEHSLVTPEAGGTATISAQAQVQAPRRTGGEARSVWRTALGERLVPQHIRALATKDLKYYWRDPSLKVLLFQFVVLAAILLGGPFVTGRTDLLIATGWMVLVIPFVALLFSTMLFSMNTLGMEQSGLAMLFLFPVRPQHILWAKNLAASVLSLAGMAVLVVATALLSRAWELVIPALLIGVAGLGVTLGCGNLASVFFPQRQGRRAIRASGAAPSGSWLRGVFSLLMWFFTALALMPIALATALPRLAGTPWIWAFTIPAALCYGLLFYLVVTHYAAARLLAKAPEILEMVASE